MRVCLSDFSSHIEAALPAVEIETEAFCLIERRGCALCLTFCR